MSLYKYIYPIFKEIVFKLDPEFIHDLTIQGMNKLGPILKLNQSYNFKVKAMGLNFTSPIGLAAGLDKNAEAIDFLTTLPFGFIECGTVTPKPQIGNDRPRLFRYPNEESLRNCMGFNNLGADAVLRNVFKSNKHEKILGMNLGKNKNTPNELAHEDYAILYRQFANYVDYLVINVSSPNTPGLRDLLNEQGLKDIFEAVSIERMNKSKPLFVKVSPDMDNEALRGVVDLVKRYKLTGIIATNTTIMSERGPGGMSGRILFEKSKQVREFLLNEIKDHPEIELIGVGGFSSFDEIKDFWKKGGKLVQLYSSFVFQGPLILKSIETKLKSEYVQYKVDNFEDYLKEIRKYKN